MLLVGSHVSFNKNNQLVGSVLEAIKYSSNTFMFYTGAPQNTNRCILDSNLTKEAHKLMLDNNIDINKVIVHAPYIINLGNKININNYLFAINFLKEEIKRCDELNIKYIVLHPGSHVKETEEAGINNIVEGLKEVLKDYTGNVTILLETMAGKGSELGKTIDEIKYIIDNVNSKNIGVCLDTCHLNDSGYNLVKFDEYLEEFDKKIGINIIGCVHVNDSKNSVGDRKDRHENIGFGTIGFENLLKVLYHEKLKYIPKILETPYIDKLYPPYKEEIEMIRNRKFDPGIIDKIKKNYSKQ